MIQHVFIVSAQQALGTQCFWYYEGTLAHKLKNVWFFAYNLRMERGTVLILTWLSIPISLSRLKNFKKFISFLNLTQT